jgi:hypothetical protein
MTGPYPTPVEHGDIIQSHHDDMKLVAIESPFAGNVAENIAYAKACLKDSMARGEAPLASHLLYPQVLDDQDADERRLGIECGYAWAKHASLIVFYTDLGWSRGMLAAKEFAQRLLIETEERSIKAGRAVTMLR